MFRVYYKYSACILIETSDISILCDPWFSDLAYHGTWSRFPNYELTPSFIGSFDCIYISHIHPDHYCKQTINRLFSYYGPKPILISDRRNTNYLHKKLINDGFGDYVRILTHYVVESTHIVFIPVDTGSRSDIDSALLVYCSSTNFAFLNTNDCEVTPQFAASINKVIKDNSLDLRLFALGYAGAGPYPQTYIPLCDEELLSQRASNKKKEFFNRYLTATKLINSRFRLPFAGKYLLNGPSSCLNQYRGVPDAIEVLDLDPNAIIIDDGGSDYFDIDDLVISGVRTQPYNIPRYVPAGTYEWNEYIGFTLSDLKLKSLCSLALDYAHNRSECEIDCIWNVFIMTEGIEVGDIISSKDPRQISSPLVRFNVNRLRHYSETNVATLVVCDMFIEPKAFIAAILGVCHWNNYEIGSVYHVRRKPDIYISSMFSYLHHFHI